MFSWYHVLAHAVLVLLVAAFGLPGLQVLHCLVPHSLFRVLSSSKAHICLTNRSLGSWAVRLQLLRCHRSRVTPLCLCHQA